MNRIESRFRELRARGRIGLIPFVTAGDPHPDATVAIMHALVRGGADLIELGIPFSDPMADGPVIQKASERAIERGVRAIDVVAWVRAFRARDTTTPVVLMGYLNPIEIHGRERFAVAAAEAGVDGLLLVDAPLEESGPIGDLLGAHGMYQILLAAPTTVGERRKALASRAAGFLYYVAFAGVTGASRLDAADVGAHIAELRRLTDVPVAVGFGVRDAQTAVSVAAHADAVVIGSALVEHLAASADGQSATAAAENFLAPLRAALDDLACRTVGAAAAV